MKRCETCYTNTDRFVTYTTVGTDEERVVCKSCDKAERFARYRETKIITSSTMIDASLISYDVRKKIALQPGEGGIAALACEITDAVERVHRIVKRFERVVWYGLDNPSRPSMQAVTCASKTSGLSAKLLCDGTTTKFLSFCSAARCMMTIDQGNYQITVITAEDEPPNQEFRGTKAPGEGPMGIQGMYATEVQAIALLEAAIFAWNADKLHLKADKKVSMI